MIELLSNLKTLEEKHINIKSERVAYFRSEPVMNFFNYFFENKDKFLINKLDIQYDYMLEDKYIKSFELEITMSKTTYVYLLDRFKSVLERYYNDHVFVPYNIRR